MIYCFSGEDDWNIVILECEALATKWMELGAYLGLSVGRIDTIKADFFNDTHGCLYEMFRYWIQQNYNTAKFGPPSWKVLLKSVAMIDKLLFMKLAQSHQGIIIFIVPWL